MDLKAADAALAYSRALTQAQGAGGAGGTESTGKGGQFAEVLQKAVEGAIDASRASEQAVMAANVNQAELVDIITAVTNAELTLETVVAVRDRMIEAYQEIMRMPI